MSHTLEELASELLLKEINQHKNDFLTWKAKNRSREGTAAYQQYVEQFGQWEEDARRMLEQMREQIAKAEQHKILDQMAAEVALLESYQKSFLEYHRKALEQEQQASEALSQAVIRMNAARESSSHSDLSCTDASEAAIFNSFLDGLATAANFLSGEEMPLETANQDDDSGPAYNGLDLEAHASPGLPSFAFSFAEPFEDGELDLMFQEWGDQAAPSGEMSFEADGQ